MSKPDPGPRLHEGWIATEAAEADGVPVDARLVDTQRLLQATALLSLCGMLLFVEIRPVVSMMALFLAVFGYLCLARPLWKLESRTTVLGIGLLGVIFCGIAFFRLYSEFFDPAVGQLTEALMVTFRTASAATVIAALLGVVFAALRPLLAHWIGRSAGNVWELLLGLLEPMPVILPVIIAIPLLAGRLPFVQQLRCSLVMGLAMAISARRVPAAVIAFHERTGFVRATLAIAATGGDGKARSVGIARIIFHHILLRAGASSVILGTAALLTDALVLEISTGYVVDQLSVAKELGGEMYPGLGVLFARHFRHDMLNTRSTVPLHDYVLVLATTALLAGAWLTAKGLSRTSKQLREGSVGRNQLNEAWSWMPPRLHGRRKP